MTKQQGRYLIGVLSLYFAYCVHPSGEGVLLVMFAFIGALSFALGIIQGFER